MKTDEDTDTLSGQHGRKDVDHGAGIEPQLSIGTECEVTYRVGAADSPRMLRLNDTDEFPDVLSTAKMIGLMEVAAARLMRPLLKPNELSVGVKVDVEHLAATPLFTDIAIRAHYVGQEGKLFLFDVELLDSGGLAGKGRHARAIVQADRLVEGAKRRITHKGDKL